jgi:integrase
MPRRKAVDRKPLTDRLLKAFDPDGKRTDLYDGLVPELGYRCSRPGSGAFFTSYTTPVGRRRRMTLGHYPALSLADARIQAQDVRQQAKEGGDPAQAARQKISQRAAEQDDRSDRNFEAMMELYIARVADLQKSGHEKARAIRKYAMPLFRQVPVDEITTRDVSQFLHRLRDQSGPVQANRVSVYLSAAFKWLVRNGYANANPASGIGRVSPEREKPRDHILTDDEVKSLWKAVEAAPTPFGRIAQLALLTAQRRGTIAAMNWDDLDLDERLWAIRAEDMKSGRRHVLPLSAQAVDVISKVGRQNGTYVFGKAGARPYSGFSRGKKNLDVLCGDVEWRLHDLRRTANTRLIGFADKDVRRRILDHVPAANDVEAIHYDRFDWLPRMRTALELLGNHIDAVVGGPSDNVEQMVNRGG